MKIVKTPHAILLAAYQVKFFSKRNIYFEVLFIRVLFSVQDNSILDHTAQCDDHCPMDCPFGIANKTVNGRCICVCAPDPCEVSTNMITVKFYYFF
jgi:hypothetical protein